MRTRFMTTATTVNNRQSLRRTLRTRRRQLTQKQQQSASQRLFLKLIKHPALLQARTLAVYLASDGEIDLSNFIAWAWRKKKQVYLPVITGKTNMKFRSFTPTSTLARNHFKLLEPTRGALIKPWEIDVVLTPLVGFDRCGKRLGMGGGFYDRCFAFMQNPQQPSFKMPQLIGTAHSCQEVAQLSTEIWDIALQEIMTDSSAYKTVASAQ